MICFGIIIDAVSAHAMTVKTPAQIEDYIIYKAMRENLSVGMVVAIAKSESGFNKDAHNPDSTASGVFQFLDGTFRTYCIDKYDRAESMSQKNDPVIQVNCAVDMLLEKNGYKHWYASFAGWGHHLS